MTNPPKSLGEALPAEMARVRDKIIPLYMQCGPGGAVALFMMRADLDRAANAMAQGDVVAMMKSYQSLQGWQE